MEKKNAFICINSSLLSEPKWAPGPEGSSPEPCQAVRAGKETELTRRADLSRAGPPESWEG